MPHDNEVDFLRKTLIEARQRRPIICSEDLFICNKGSFLTFVTAVTALLDEHHLSWASNSFKPFKSPVPAGIIQANRVRLGYITET